MSTLREYETAFEENPGQMQAFLALRKVYRERRKFDKLVTLYELRAQSLEEEAKAADLFFLAAEVRIDHLGDSAGAETDLLHALDRYPAHIKAAERLKLIYRDQGRTSDYMTMLEMEAAAVVQTADGQRKAHLQQEMSQLFATHLANLERAAQGPQRVKEITPDAIKMVESARKIYRALADWPNVVRLYDLELVAVTDAQKRSDLLIVYAKVLCEKMNRLEEAVEKLAEVIRLRPRDEKALELQASIYARPEWSGADGKDKAAALYFQIARRRHEAGDVDGAVGLLRRALVAVPSHEESGRLIERILYEGRRLQDLDRYYRERAAEARDADEKMDFLFKRAQLAERDLHDQAEALRVYEEIVGVEPPGGPASQHLATLYSSRQNYGKLADLRERQLEVISDPAVRMPLLRELAVLYRDRLGDAEQSAVYVHAILQIDPGDEEAQQAYGDHFRRKSDWPSLLDLLEFSFDHAQRTGAPVERRMARLEEIAVLAERQLGDGARALAAWQKMEEIAPQHDRAREAQKRLLMKEKSWDGLAKVLQREAKAVTDPARKVELHRRLAKLYIEKVGDAGRGVEWFRKVLAEEPGDAASFRALAEIFEHQARWQDLAEVVRGQLDVVPDGDKVGLLRRLAPLYEEKLNSPGEAAWALRQILALQPGDRDSYLRLANVLAAVGDRAGLADVLEAHAGHAGEGERADLLRRAARLAQSELHDGTRAARLWEQLIEIVPGDDQALEALEAAYQELERPAELARVLELRIERVADDPAAQSEFLRRLARLAQSALAQPDRAQKAWEYLQKTLPNDAEALAALTGLYRAGAAWRRLEQVIAHRVALASDPQQAVELALDRAQVLEERLRSSGEAVDVLEQVVGELDPRNIEAFTRLRRIAESNGDWQRVVGVAERQITLHADPAARLTAALEIGTIERDRLGDPVRATAAFERALAMAPENVIALGALAALYAAAGSAEKLVAVDETLLSLTEDPAERYRLMNEIADTYEDGLEDAARSFEWARRAHGERPGDDSMQRIEGLAAAHGLWEELVRVYEGERDRAVAATDQIDISRRIALVCEVRLTNPARALNVFRDALAYQPDGNTLLVDIERLSAQVGEWSVLLDVYARVARARPAIEERIGLLERRASVRETNLSDPSGALDEWMRCFGLDPEYPRAHAEILRLAGVTGRWEDALKIEAQRFARAADTEDKIVVAKRAAAIVEENVKDRVRAFRAYLNAFRLSPEDPEVNEHLWRLAGLIGRYDQSGARPPVIKEMALVEVGRSSARPDATIHLDVQRDAGVLVGKEIHEDTGVFDLADAEEVDEDVEALDADEDLQEITDADVVGTRPPVPGARSGGGAFASAWEEFAHAFSLLPANDNATQRRYLLRVAEIWERGAKDPERAFAALENAFRLDPSDALVRAELRRMGQEQSDWDRVSDIYLSVIGPSLSVEHAVELNHEVAAFREELGQRDKAEQRYRAIVNLSSDDRKAQDALEDITRTESRFGDLAGLLERRTSSALDRSGEVPARSLSDEEWRARSLELADLYENRLDRPYEAIDTLERHLARIEDEARAIEDPELLAELAQVFAALARLYGRVDLWSKAVDALKKEMDIAPNAEARRAIGMRLGRVYEKELSNAPRAVEAYQSVLADAPADDEALAALDRLLESQGRYEDLSGLLERRIASATDPAGKLALVKRRARILEERLDNPDAAAANLRSLGADTLDDDDMAASLLRNLRRAGLVHEAGKLLAQRIERATQRGAEASVVAGLYSELARLRLEDASDIAGAAEALQGAIALRPNDLEALGLLGRLALKKNDFPGFAAAREREAEALAAVPGKQAEALAAFLDVGGMFRDQLGDPAAAQRCFERALREVPESAAAMRALASLLMGRGQTEEARAVLTRQLEVVTEPEARAVALTDLARVVWEKPGDADRAIPYLDAAIDLAPDYLPAMITLADIYYKEQQWEQAERRLTQAVRRLRGRGPEAAPLYYRLAEIYERLGKLDEGYKQLQDAERKNPGLLLVTIAIGGNRFHARKWREAIAILENVAEHEDAARYPEEVAKALSYCGQAHQKNKQPDKARAAFESALLFAADEKTALEALADFAVEAGDRVAAADYLRKVVDTSHDRAEKARLLERIGDLHGERGDTEQARACFEAAVELLETPTQADVGLLEKTLLLQKNAGAIADATETSTRLIALVGDPKERAKKRRDAAATLIEHGQVARAAELLTQTLEDDAGDERALAMLVEAHERLGKPDASVFLLERILPGLPPPSGKAAAISARALLWKKLGELRKATDEGGAISALERAVAIDATLVSARVALTEMYGKEQGDAALLNHRALVHADLTSADSLRILGKAYDKKDNPDGARCFFELLDLLGLAKKSDRNYLSAHPAPMQRSEEPYPGVVSDDARARFLSHPESRLMAEIMATLWDAGLDFEGPTLESLNVKAEDKISPVSEGEIAKIYAEISKALDTKKTSLYRGFDPGLTGMRIALSRPPSVVVAAGLADDGRAPELRFRLGRAIELSRPEYILAAAVGSKAFSQLFGNILKAFHPRQARRRGPAGDAGPDAAAKLKKALPYKISKQLAELFEKLGNTPFSSARWRDVVDQTGNRAGLLMCGELGVAARVVLADSLDMPVDDVDTAMLDDHANQPGPLRELLRFGVSDEYFALRAALGLGAKAAA